MRAPATIAIVTATAVCAVLAGHIGEADAGCAPHARAGSAHVVVHSSPAPPQRPTRCH
jgi:hypothetical protein